MSEPLLSVEQVAELIGVPASTIYQWNSRGVGSDGRPWIKRIQVGRYVRYRASDLEQWLSDNAVESGGFRHDPPQEEPAGGYRRAQHTRRSIHVHAQV